jgi:hypothetical protein
MIPLAGDQDTADVPTIQSGNDSIDGGAEAILSRVIIQRRVGLWRRRHDRGGDGDDHIFGDQIAGCLRIRRRRDDLISGECRKRTSSPLAQGFDTIDGRHRRRQRLWRRWRRFEFWETPEPITLSGDIALLRI